MKWIGQHIYDLVSRFRDDVYLEDIDTGTIASGGNLGLDSNNKIVKATVSSGSGDITGVDLTGALPITISSETNTTSGDYSSTIGINVGNGILIDGSGDLVTNDSEIDHDSLDNFAANEHFTQANITTVGTIGTGVWNGDAIAHDYIAADAIETDNIADAQVTVAKLHGDAVQTSGETFADNDTSLMTSAAINDRIESFGYTANTGDITGVDLTGAGPMVISSETGTTSGDYSATIGIVNASDTVIGAVELATTAETTTGTDTTRAVTPDGLKDGYRGSSNIATVGIIGAGEWRGTAINATYLQGQSGINTGNETLSSINALDITEVGTIDSGVWNGTAIAQAYIAGDAINGDKIEDDAVDSEHYVDGSIDTAHIADDQVTFAKAQGVTSNIFGNTIKLLPSDFMGNDDAGVTKTIQFVDEDASGLKPGNANTELLAFVSIPQGMSIDKVDVYAGGTFGIDVIEMDVNVSNGDLSGSSIGTGNCNTQVECTNTASTATNYFMIQVSTANTGHRVYGGIVTIV